LDEKALLNAAKKCAFLPNFGRIFRFFREIFLR
jgi:hypothetical protein